MPSFLSFFYKSSILINVILAPLKGFAVNYVFTDKTVSQNNSACRPMRRNINYSSDEVSFGYLMKQTEKHKKFKTLKCSREETNCYGQELKITLCDLF